MAWVGFDRMIRTAERAGLNSPLDRWRAARSAIHQDVCQNGFDPARQTFTQFYGSRGLDAALLLIPRVGFLPAHDPRVLGTVEAVRQELSEDGLVLRYRTDADPHSVFGTLDGIPGSEGAFLACSFWLADALALTGREDEARGLFERLLGRFARRVHDRLMSDSPDRGRPPLLGVPLRHEESLLCRSTAPPPPRSAPPRTSAAVG